MQYWVAALEPMREDDGGLEHVEWQRQEAKQAASFLAAKHRAGRPESVPTQHPRSWDGGAMAVEEALAWKDGFEAGKRVGEDAAEGRGRRAGYAEGWYARGRSDARDRQETEAGYIKEGGQRAAAEQRRCTCVLWKDRRRWCGDGCGYGWVDEQAGTERQGRETEDDEAE